MHVGQIENANRTIGASQGYIGLPIRDGVFDCPVNGAATPFMASAWHPTPDEIARIVQGAPIILQVLGSSHPPVMLEVGAV